MTFREIHLEPESPFQAPQRHCQVPGGTKLCSPAPKSRANYLIINNSKIQVNFTKLTRRSRWIIEGCQYVIAERLMRLHSDKFHHLHSNGDLHILAFCSLFHLRVILIAVEQSPRVAAPPLGMGPEREKRNRHPFRGWTPVHSLL